jgi:hypothetical protein
MGRGWGVVGVVIAFVRVIEGGSGFFAGVDQGGVGEDGEGFADEGQVHGGSAFESGGRAWRGGGGCGGGVAGFGGGIFEVNAQAAADDGGEFITDLLKDAFVAGEVHDFAVAGGGGEGGVMFVEAQQLDEAEPG